MPNSFSKSILNILTIFSITAIILVSGCANLKYNDKYEKCVRRVNDPNTVVYFAITENNKTEKYCECVAKSPDYGLNCLNEVLTND